MVSDNKVLLSNFLSLSGVQIAGYIFPLMTVPYLVRVLGPEKFGVIAFAQAFIQYFVLITDYGFNFSATKAISISRDNKERVAEIFSAVMAAKIILMSFSFVLLSAFIFSIEKFRSEWLVYIFTFGTVVGNVLFPIWLFQGMERMRQMAILNILSQMIFTLFVFLLIKDENDYIYIPLISSCGSITSGLLSLLIVFNKLEIKLKLPTFCGIKQELKNGWYIFLTSITASIFNNSNTFILGIFTNNTIVGYYSAGEKIIGAAKGILGPVSQTLYPHFSKLAFQSRNSALTQINKAVKIIGIPIFFVSLGLLVFAHEITEIFLGKNFIESKVVVQTLSFLPFVIALSNLFTVQGLYAFGFQSVVSRFTMAIALSHIVLVSVLTYFFSFAGTSMALLLSEILIAVCSFFFYKRLIMCN